MQLFYVKYNPSNAWYWVHKRHNDHNHNHKDKHDAVMSLMSQWERLKSQS